MKAINLIQQIVEAGVTIVTRIPERVINAQTVNDFSVLIEIVVTAFRRMRSRRQRAFGSQRNGTRSESSSLKIPRPRR